MAMLLSSATREKEYPLLHLESHMEGQPLIAVSRLPT